MMRRVTREPLLVARREALAADLVLVVVTAIWGSTFIVNRIVLETSPPLLFVLSRFTLAAAVLFLLAQNRPRTPHLARDSAAVGLLLALGIGCQVVGQLFTSASKAAFLTGLSVPLTPVAGYVLTRKKPSSENLAGLVVAAAGFAVLTWPKDAASGVNAGDVLILVTAVSYAVLIVIVSETAATHDVRWYSFGQIVFAAAGVGAVRLALAPFVRGRGAFLAAEARPLVLDRTVVLAVNNVNVRTLDDLSRAVESGFSRSSLVLSVLREPYVYNLTFGLD